MQNLAKSIGKKAESAVQYTMVAKNLRNSNAKLIQCLLCQILCIPGYFRAFGRWKRKS